MKNLKWSGLAINGFVALAVGLVFIFMPQNLIQTIVELIGFVLGLSGVVMLFFTFFRRKSKGAINVYYLIQGLINIALGALMFFKPTQMINFVMLIIGLWAVAIGVFQIIYGLQIRKTVKSGLFLLISGLVFLVLGLLMIFNPEAVINTMLAIVGAVICLLGVILLYFSRLGYKQNKFTDYEEITDND